ncbi:Histidinol phosphatase [Pseudomonas asplenii]|uniref:Histidinol phosphatase n=1 Tax=Pseudomonas asplenii TaxID=53407 RepID=A0A1H1WGF6_9PSED|nr:PHP-associated domain-containing protein [Pseudomonas asplenii]SDS95396.1 Histidinol phosphatase [Pseudomonas asplenii]
MEFVGARWWKFDFHTHTPASMDYAKSQPHLKENMTPRDWLLPYIENGIECVAITDHNSGDWVDRLKEAAEELRAEGFSIFIFPGVEITANSNIHILAIFDPSKDTQFVNGVVGATHYRGTRGDSDAVAEDSAEAIVEEIIKSGGVAIPAHIDMAAGMCQINSSHTISQLCSKSSAVEIIFPNGKPPETHRAALGPYKSLNFNLPEVIGSDSHAPDTVGRAFTWVKMSSPTIDGLRLALIDGESSIKRSDNCTGDPNATSESLILSLCVTDAKYCGRGKKFFVEFNPWLNSVIGGRGSGKSSLLEFLRLATGRGNDLISLPKGNEIKNNFERFVKKSLSRDDDGVMQDSTLLEVEVMKQGARYKLSWRYGSEIVEIDKLVDGEWIAEEGDASSRFPIKVFSQKQIFDFAKNPNALLRLIDSSEQVNHLAWKMEYEEETNKFLRLNVQKREFQAKITNRAALVGQLSDVNQKIDVIEKSGHTQILSNFQKFTVQQSVLKEHFNNLEGGWAGALQIVEDLQFDDFNLQGFSEEEEDELEVLKEFHALSSDLELSKQNALACVRDAESKIGALKDWLVGSAYQAKQNDVKSKYGELVQSLTEKGVSNPGIYHELIKQRDALKASIDALDLLKSKVDELHAESLSAYARMIELRKELTRRRNGFIKEHIEGNNSIELKVEPLADDVDLDYEFRSLISRHDGAFAGDIFDSERETGILNALNKSVLAIARTDDDSALNLRMDAVHKFKVDFVRFKEGAVLGVQLGRRFIDFVGLLRPEVMNQIVAWFPGDKLVVKYNDGKRMKDISQGSAGQKAATVLSFLLSYGDEPLVLDQPEDDLDNGLITSLIVSKLQKNKAERQVIVVTHNPNIVVNADSEYVIALQDRGQIELTASGSLQDLDVRRQVCEIMEGGEAALLQRYRRMVNI